LERSFQQQRQFVEDASHELRTPIAIVEGHLGMLRRWGKHDPAVLEESLQISVEELSRLKALVEELLVLTRAENLQMDEAAAVCEPEQVISQTVKKVNVLHPAFIIERDLQALSGVKLAISAEHLEQILLILLDNAVKYSRERKRIAVRAAIQGERARLEIIDAGIGIPAKDLPYVTDRLYRVDKARNRKSGAMDGNGLGLSIAKRLVERYNGALTIESVEQEGTTVNVLLP
ncbi:UNVERIFIED_CONTAM: ATP-binding protein, partial [Klebsiella pneumoniae]